MSSVDEIIEELESLSRPGQLEGMARFGISTDNRFGVSIPDLRRLAKRTGRDHELALKLWETGIDDARILAGMIGEPEKLTDKQMDDWAAGFNSWDVCDQVCMNLFDKTPLAWEKVREWSTREEEFVKRAAYALIACLAWHDKKAGDEKFTAFLPLIVAGATDERNFVKKAVNWALRHTGKRNITLHKQALRTAYMIKRIDSKAARWIASDAIRELESGKVVERLKSRE